MIRNTNYENNLFEQIIRIKSLMNESKGYGDLIMEGPITGIFKLMVGALDNIVKAGKISDNLLKDAAVAVGKMADEAAAVMKFKTFYKQAIDGNNGVIISELAEATIKNMPPDSAKNIDDLEKAFVADAVSNGSINNSLLDSLKTTIRKNIKLPDQLLDMQNIIEAKILSRIKKTAEEALDVASTTVAGTSKILDTTFDDVIKQANDVLKKEVPPKKISREILENAEKQVDEIEAAFKKGEITQEELYDYLLKQAVENKSNIDKFKEMLPKYSGLIGTIYDSITGGIAKFWAGLGKIFTMKNLKIFLMACLIGYAATGIYKGEYNPWNWWGVGKAQQCFGDDKTVECVKAIPGYQMLDSTQVGLLCNLREIPQNEGVGRLSCDNINELAKPEVKVKSISFKAADGVGKIDKFELTFADGNIKIYDANTGKEVTTTTSTTTTPAPTTPAPTTCEWKNETEAKAAIKGTFKTAKDDEIRVDLIACVAYYTPPGMEDEGEQAYKPEDL